MKILHVAETAKGGVASYLRDILDLQAAALGVNAVRVVLPAEHAGQLGGCVARLESFARPSRSAVGLCRLAITLSHVVREFRPDVIHAHSTFAGAIVRAIYGWRRQRPVLVYCPHGWAFAMRTSAWKQAILRRCERWLSVLCDRIVAVSAEEAVAGSSIGINPTKISMIRNAIPLAAPASTPVAWHDTRRKVLFVGRLDRQKGFDILANAVAGLEDRVAVRVAGEAVLAKRAAPLADNIEYLGWRNASEIEGQLQQADLLVLPSRWEGLPLTALEAMRAAKPVVAAAVGGLREVVTDGITGRLVPADDVRALRAALLADDDATLRTMGRAGRLLFQQNFTSNRMHQELMALYASLLEALAMPSRIDEAENIVPVSEKMSDLSSF